MEFFFGMAIWAFLLGTIGLLLGALLSFVGVPLVLKLRKSRESDRRFGCLPKIGLTVLVSIAFVATILCLGSWLTEKDSDDYWNARGSWDWQRMPLEYPYHLIALDDLDEGFIEHWETRSQAVHGITRFYKSGTVVVGQAPLRFFSLNCGSGQVVWYANIEEYLQALEKLGFEEEPELLTIEENIRLYWNSH